VNAVAADAIVVGHQDAQHPGSVHGGDSGRGSAPFAG
jgi:hypothetical protein